MGVLIPAMLFSIIIMLDVGSLLEASTTHKLLSTREVVTQMDTKPLKI